MKKIMEKKKKRMKLLSMTQRKSQQMQEKYQKLLTRKIGEKRIYA
jgi:hypothetical protein